MLLYRESETLLCQDQDGIQQLFIYQGDITQNNPAAHPKNQNLFPDSTCSLTPHRVREWWNGVMQESLECVIGSAFGSYNVCDNLLLWFSLSFAKC